ncbi:TolC family protein [Flavobacteriaceae bacterium]|nr:TolC family protein [Flavobacteriaceae bacterium]
MKKTLLVLVCAILGISTYAQETKTHELSLKEAIDFALTNNRSIKSASLGIEAAEEQKWETTATGLPQINAEVKYQNFLDYPIPDSFIAASPALAFQLPKQQLTPSITLSQLLFDGSYLVALQSSKVFLEISKNAATKTKNQIEVEAIKAYANALLIDESIKITQLNKQALENNLSEIKQIYENGLTEEENVEQLELTLASLQNNLNRLLQLKVTSHNVLKVILSLPQDHTIVLKDTLEKMYLTNSALKKQKFSYFNNIDVKISENNQKAKELLYKLEKSRLLPSLSTFINAGYQGNSQEFTFFDSSQEWFGSILWGVNLKIPIFSSGAGRSRISRAKINWEIAKNELLTTQATVNVEIQNAQTELDFALKNYDNKKKSLALATKIENKNNVKFKEGITSSFELRQAQVQLYSMQQEYLQAIVDIINKKAALQNLNK